MIGIRVRRKACGQSESRKDEMRYQGKIVEWNDDRGFGFIVRNDGGPSAFVHIKAFTSQRRRPVVGDIVTYEVRMDPQARAQAQRVAFVAPRPASPPSASSAPGGLALAFTAVFMLFLAASALVGLLPLAVLALYCVASAVTFVAYALDKSAAQNQRWRTPEQTLHLLAIAGGWPGAWVAQRLFRHKTSKISFRRVFWATVVINCILLGVLLSPLGTEWRGALIVH
jgi:uncharacterized membrane protein YsdA (DUF1294 family)/cold shock CspA family protein